jgi:1,4-alpha-glucan branching enzyme
MGCEFGQGGEWAFEGQLDWWLLDSPLHQGVQNVMRDLNNLNKNQPALYEKAFSHEGFEWVAYDDADNSVISYIRKGNNIEESLLVVINMTPVVHNNYEVGVNQAGIWREILNTDYAKYGGSDMYNGGELRTKAVEKHGRAQVLSLTLSPLSVMVFKLERAETMQIAEASSEEKPKKGRKKVTA